MCIASSDSSMCLHKLSSHLIFIKYEKKDVSYEKKKLFSRGLLQNFHFAEWLKQYYFIKHLYLVVFQKFKVILHILAVSSIVLCLLTVADLIALTIPELRSETV